MDGLTNYLRHPDGGRTAEEVRKHLRTWDKARRRAVTLDLPELSPHEQMKALTGMIGDVEKRHREFAHRVNAMKYAREGRNPNEAFVRQFQVLLED